MHSLTLEYLAALRFDGTQAATLRSLDEYPGKQQLYAAQSPEALKGLRQITVVESTESSNRLEGVVVAPSRLKSLVIRNAAPKSRSEQEIAGYHDALALIHESAAHMSFNEGVVLQLHTLISEIEEACPDMSRDMVRLVLRAMKSEGLIESTGKGRGAKWLRINQGGEK